MGICATEKTKDKRRKTTLRIDWEEKHRKQMESAYEKIDRLQEVHNLIDKDIVKDMECK